jgi:flagellin
MSSSLVVDTNMSALQALNDLNATDNAMTTAINKLSSGLQIANAATGPAQYVVSQALESQANGYETAINNAQDGVSLIQTASGALSQISSILQTMDQLALTSANGATSTSTALAANQSEFTDLMKSIDEIAGTTTYGTTNLLIGTKSATHPYTTAWSGTLQVGAFDLTNQRIKLSITAVTSEALGLTGGPATVTGAAIATGKVTLTAAATLKFSVDTGAHVFAVKFTAGTYTVTQIVTKINSDATVKSYVVASTATHKLTLSTVQTGTGAQLTVTAETSFGFTAAKSATGTNTVSTSIATAAEAQHAIKVVQAALSKVDSVASSVGATQNELNAIVANLTVGQQNLSAANSQLVDVNMAQEMTTFSTEQILMQTGVAMLAQAQQAPSLVEKLV